MEKLFDKLERTIDGKWHNIKMSSVIFFIMTVVLSVILVYCFAEKKEGYNADEVWSYGYANSYYSRDLNTKSKTVYNDSDLFAVEEKYEYIINEWIDSKVIHDYLAVNKGEEFTYDSVYYNHIDDLSPPLYSFILHTICSFFPEVFSKWFAFSINLVSAVIALIYLYKFVSLLKNDKYALICCALYGFSLGFVDVSIYLRMYALETAFMMMASYYISMYVKDEKPLSSIIFSIIACVCGFLTSYYFISMIGLVTFFMCAYLTLKKRIKKMFVLGFSMLGALIISSVIFPTFARTIIRKLINSSERTQSLANYNFKFRVCIIANMFLSREYGFMVPYYESGFFRIIIGVMFFVLIVCLPLLFWLRNTSIIKNQVKKLKAFFKSIPTRINNIIKNADWLLFIFFLAFIIQAVVIGETCNIGGMGIYSVRYLLFIFPIGVFVFTCYIYRFLKFLFRKRKKYVVKTAFVILSLLIMFVNIMHIIGGSVFYFKRETEGMTVKEAVSDGYVILLDNDLWHLMQIAPEFLEAKQYFQTEGKTYMDSIDKYKSKLEEGKLVLIIDKSQYISVLDGAKGVDIIGEGYTERKNEMQEKYDGIIDFFEDLDTNSKMLYVSTEKYFSDYMEVYIVNP